MRKKNKLSKKKNGDSLPFQRSYLRLLGEYSSTYLSLDLDLDLDLSRRLLLRSRDRDLLSRSFEARRAPPKDFASIPRKVSCKELIKILHRSSWATFDCRINEIAVTKVSMAEA